MWTLVAESGAFWIFFSAPELRQQGFTGSVQTVRRFLHPLRRTAPRPSGPAVPRPEVPKPRHLTRWVVIDPRYLKPEQADQLATRWPAAQSYKPPPTTSASSPT